MSHHGILFSAPMVRALVNGQKTQTRRLASSPLNRRRPGDTLWVREDWKAPKLCDAVKASEIEMQPAHRVAIEYQADKRRWDAVPGLEKLPLTFGRRRASMHMPRAFSRLTLTVTDARIQRLHDITPADAEAEGIVSDTDRGGLLFYHLPGVDIERRANPVDVYADLWNLLHTEPGQRWADNPEAICLTFIVEKTR